MPFTHWIKAVSINFTGYCSKISEVIATPLLLKASVVKGTEVISPWLLLLTEKKGMYIK